MGEGEREGLHHGYWGMDAPGRGPVTVSNIWQPRTHEQS